MQHKIGILLRLWHWQLLTTHFTPYKDYIKTYMYLRMKQDPLNSYLLHCFVMDRLSAVDVVKKFVCANKECKRHFGKYEWGKHLI